MSIMNNNSRKPLLIFCKLLEFVQSIIITYLHDVIYQLWDLAIRLNHWDYVWEHAFVKNSSFFNQCQEIFYSQK